MPNLFRHLLKIRIQILKQVQDDILKNLVLIHDINRQYVNSRLRHDNL